MPVAGTYRVWSGDQPAVRTATRRPQGQPISGTEVREVRFSTGFRGYDQFLVDELLAVRTPSRPSGRVAGGEPPWETSAHPALRIAFSTSRSDIGFISLALGPLDATHQGFLDELWTGLSRFEPRTQDHADGRYDCCASFKAR